MIKMTHPDSELTIEVPEGREDMYRSQGWREAEAAAPPGNASLEAWQTYARDRGFADEDIDGKTRDELRAALS